MGGVIQHEARDLKTLMTFFQLSASNQAGIEGVDEFRDLAHTAVTGSKEPADGNA